MGKTIGLVSIKGGVGKTTVSAALATDLANHYKKKVLLIDANYSAPNLGVHMDVMNPENTIHDVLSGKMRVSSAVKNRFGVDVVAGDYMFRGRLNPLKLQSKLKKTKKVYDYVILDSSPNLNEEILSTMLASDNLFVVSTPDYPTLICSLRAAHLAKQRGKPISGMIVNKVRDPRFEVSLKELEETTEIPVVARLPDDKKLGRSVYTRIPMPLYKRKSAFSKELTKLSSALTRDEEKRRWFDWLSLKNFKREEVNRQVLKEGFYKKQFGGGNG